MPAWDTAHALRPAHSGCGARRRSGKPRPARAGLRRSSVSPAADPPPVDAPVHI